MVIKTGIIGEYDDAPNPWYERFKKLESKLTQLDVFECEGRYYYGSPIEAIKEFIEANPQPADFSVWLQDNWTVFEPLRDQSL